MTITAVVFDLDGTLIDSEKWHTRTWVEAFEKFGYKIDYDDSLYIRSLDFHLSQEFFRGRFGKELDFAPIRDEKVRIMSEYVKEYGIEPKPGLVETMRYMKSKGLKTAIATGTNMEDLGKMLADLGIAEYLDATVSTGMVKRGKPAPDVYLHVSEVIGVDPKECIAVEDSPNGVRSAYDAGFNVVFIPDLTQADDEIMKKARVCDSLPGLKELVREGPRCPLPHARSSMMPTAANTRTIRKPWRKAPDSRSRERTLTKIAIASSAGRRTGSPRPATYGRAMFWSQTATSVFMRHGSPAGTSWSSPTWG